MQKRFRHLEKIDNARAALSTLKSQWNHWLTSAAMVIEERVVNDDCCLYLKLAEPTPGKFCDYAADVVDNLRSALEHAVSSIAHDAGSDPDSVNFPFAGSEAAYVSKGVRSKISNLPFTVQNYIDGLKPYGEGNQRLWGFGKLANIDKHSYCIPFAAIGGFSSAKVNVR